TRFRSLLCLTSAQKPRQEGESFNLTTHSNLTLHPRHRGISKQEWRLGRDVKIAIWEKGIGYSYPKGPFQGRVTINETSITLFDLRPNDSTTLTYFAEDSVGTEEEYPYVLRSEEHTSELQSRFDLVCRLLLEKKNNRQREP